MAARLVHELGDVILRMAMAVDELSVAFSFLDRVKVLALDVLD